MPRGRSSSMVDYQYFCESHFQEMGMRSGFTPYIMQHVGSRIIRNPSRKCSADACYHQATWMLPEKFHIEIGVCRRCKGQHLKGDKFCPTCWGGLTRSSLSTLARSTLARTAFGRRLTSLWESWNERSPASTAERSPWGSPSAQSVAAPLR